MNYQQRNRALFEWFRERCERTAKTKEPQMGAKLIFGEHLPFAQFCSGCDIRDEELKIRAGFNGAYAFILLYRP